MIPIRDNLGPRGMCPVTWMIAGVCVAVFVWQYRLPMVEQAVFEQTYGLRSSVVWHAWREFVAGRTDLPQLLRDGLLPLCSHSLLHCGPVHLLANLFAWMVLGMRLEAQAGSLRFVVFVLACQLFGAAAWLLWGSDTRQPLVGASAVLVGVVLAYAVWAFRARVSLLVLPLPLFVEVPALVLMLGWLVLQFPPVLCFLAKGGGSVSAMPLHWLAYVGGASAGLALAVLLWPRRRQK